MILGEDKWLLFTGRHFWNRKCRKKTWWQQEFAVFKCEATANSVTGHVCVNSNGNTEKKDGWIKVVFLFCVKCIRMVVSNENVVFSSWCAAE